MIDNVNQSIWKDPSRLCNRKNNPAVVFPFHDQHIGLSLRMLWRCLVYVLSMSPNYLAGQAVPFHSTRWTIHIL
jgi:hypothetical protein